MTRYPHEMPRLMSELRKGTESLLEILDHIQYWMRGGVSRNESLLLTPGERDFYLQQIEKRKEAAAKSGINPFM